MQRTECTGCTVCGSGGTRTTYLHINKCKECTFTFITPLATGLRRSRHFQAKHPGKLHCRSLRSSCMCMWCASVDTDTTCDTDTRRVKLVKRGTGRACACVRACVRCVCVSAVYGVHQRHFGLLSGCVLQAQPRREERIMCGVRSAQLSRVVCVADDTVWCFR